MKDQWTVLIDDTAQDSVPRVEKSQASRVKGALSRHHPMDIHSSAMHKQMTSSVRETKKGTVSVATRRLFGTMSYISSHLRGRIHGATWPPSLSLSCPPPPPPPPSLSFLPLSLSLSRPPSLALSLSPALPLSLARSLPRPALPHSLSLSRSPSLSRPHDHPFTSPSIHLLSDHPSNLTLTSFGCDDLSFCLSTRWGWQRARIENTEGAGRYS